MSGAEPLLIASLGLSAAGAGVSAFGAIQQGRAAQAQANYQAAVARNNQIIAQRSADDARKRGVFEANLQRQKFEQDLRVSSEREITVPAGLYRLINGRAAIKTLFTVLMFLFLMGGKSFEYSLW